MSITDLSREHAPVSELFQQPASPDAWEPFILSRDQIDHFKEHGYLSGIRILSEAQIDALTKELAEISQPDHPGNGLYYEFHNNEAVDPSKVLFHALGAWRIGRAFHDILWAPAFRMAAYQLLGRRFRLFHDQLFCKPASHGGVVAWHQDYSYWTWTTPMAHLSCWIGLDDATPDNGCLYFVPQSHRWGQLPVTGLTGDMEAVRSVLSDEQQACFDRRVPNVLKKGEASFHHPLTMHGSYENRSNCPRRAIVLNALTDGVVSNARAFPDPKGFPIPPQDAPMEGQFYPVLFDPERELGRLAAEIPKA